MSAAAGGPRVRTGEGGDLPAILDIYNHYVRETSITFDLEEATPASRAGWMERFSEAGPHQLLVAEADGAVAGFAYSTPFRARPAYDVTVETTVYVRAAGVRRGVGRRLYETLFARLAGERLHRAVAGVTLPNEASVAFHRAMGFEEVGVLTEVGRKFGRYWDVMFLEKPLGPA
ncbi:MAG: N-acetyltransferase family protein [Caulobacterales bacterium]|nr:N-acetyltransferase family protein [Caulobacterales bacterium]